MPRTKKPPKRGARTCRWCGEDLDGKKHRSITESYCLVKNEEEIRSRLRPRIRRIEDAYIEGKLRPELQGTDMEEKLKKRQRKMAIDASLVGSNGYDAPRNVTYMSEQGFVYSQVAVEKPFGVVVLGKVRPDGTRARKVIRRNNLFAAVHAHRLLSRKYKHVYIVSLARRYDLPPQWRFKRDKLPKKFVWCPYCADFRIFKRDPDMVKFAALKKVWSNEKERYVWVERMVWLTRCVVCDNTNRDPIYRRSNQPWEVRRINPKRRKVKPRKNAPKARQYMRRK